MTDQYGNNTMTMPKLLLLMLVGAAMWVAILFGVYGSCKAKDSFAASPYQACEHQNHFPVRVHFQPGIDTYAWHYAIVEWNLAFPGSFVEVTRDADVEVIPDKTTYVEMPCDGKKAVIHSGKDVDLIWWAAHELVHTLAVSDSIRSTTNPAGYLNPRTCPGDYDGIASYCTNRFDWLLTQDDHDMMIALGYRWRVIFPF